MRGALENLHRFSVGGAAEGGVVAAKLAGVAARLLVRANLPAMGGPRLPRSYQARLGGAAFRLNLDDYAPEDETQMFEAVLKGHQPRAKFRNRWRHGRRQGTE